MNAAATVDGDDAAGVVVDGAVVGDAAVDYYVA